MFNFGKLWGRGARTTEASTNQKETQTALLGETLTEPTIADLVKRFDHYAKGVYSKNGKTTDRYLKYKAALRFLTPMHALCTKDFKAQHLRQLQQRMTESTPKLCRETVNTYVTAIKTLFQWGTENYDLVPASVFGELRAVRGLRPNDGRARSSDGVKGIKDPDFAAVWAHIKEPHRTILQLQHLSCARPGEIVKIRPCEIDKSDAVWLYQPTEHKTKWAKKTRTIMLNEEAQGLLARYEPSDENDLYFQHQGKPYTVDALRNAIKRVCRKHSLRLFKPNQVRHTAATKIRNTHGIEAAQVMLGHAKIETTQIYAKSNVKLGKETAKKDTLSLKATAKKAVANQAQAPAPTQAQAPAPAQAPLPASAPVQAESPASEQMSVPILAAA